MKQKYCEKDIRNNFITKIWKKKDEKTRTESTMCRQNSARIYKNFACYKDDFQRLSFRLIYICFSYKSFVYHIVTN